jgi:oligopeptide/dipeptide ABC transporter ATP-binding protein
MTAAPPLLDVAGLRTVFNTDGADLAAVDGIDLRVEAGRTLAVVGESGCGKSVTSLSIMGLVPPPGRIAGGSIRFEGEQLLGASEAHLRSLRGNRMAMIFQEPMTSLNPAFTIGDQIVEALMCHRPMGRADARAAAIEALRQVRMPDAASRFDEYPHRLSGGMRQRAMIAMALVCRPKLLIADEPTTALDVTIQAQILELMRDLQRDTGMAIILITHDLGVVAELADEVAVMYAGRVVERAPVSRLFREPQHPYTVGLLGAMPRLHGRARRLPTIEGQVPGLDRPATGCRFADRCPFGDAGCRRQDPPLMPVAAAAAPVDPATLPAPAEAARLARAGEARTGEAPNLHRHWSACLKSPLDPDRLLADAA